MSERSLLDEICALLTVRTEDCWDDCSVCPFHGDCDDMEAIKDTICYAVHEEDASEEDND